MELTARMVALMREASPCFIATSMPDGSPQLTQTWVDTDGEHIIVNTVSTHQKTRNVRRDPRVSVAVANRTQPADYFSVRGRVVDIVEDGAAEHIELLAQRYLGGPYPNFGGPDETRVKLVIAVDRVVHPS